MTIKAGFRIIDDVGLFPQDEDREGDIPYFCIKLTAEEAKAVEGKVAGIYETDGIQMFPVKDRDGMTGEKALYVVWI